MLQCRTARTLLLMMTVMFVSIAHGQIPTGSLNGHDFFRVTLDHSFASPVSGRLLLFIAPDSGDAKPVDMDMMSPTSV